MTNFNTPTLYSTKFNTTHYITEFTLEFTKKNGMHPDRWSRILLAMMVAEIRKNRSDANVFINWKPWINDGYTFHIMLAHLDSNIADIIYDVLPKFKTVIQRQTRQNKCNDEFETIIEFESDICPDKYFVVREKDGCLGFTRQNCMLTYDADFTFITLNDVYKMGDFDSATA